VPYKVEPVTPEGRLIRAARTRKRLALPEAAALVGMGGTKFGILERGYDSDASRKEAVYDDADLAGIAAALDIPPEALDEIGRTEAASLLRGFPSTTADADALAAAEAEYGVLFEAILRRAERSPIPPAEADMLRFLLHDVDQDARLAPLAERVRRAVAWLDKQRAAQAQEKDIRLA
jgi:transcriptional regulator with XRE-family HTH domain